MKILLFVIMATLIACGGGGSGGGSSSAPGGSTAGGSSGGSSGGGSEVTQVNIAPEYVGLWAKCFNLSSISQLYVFSISTNSLVASYITYYGLNCQTADVGYMQKYVYQVSRSGDTYTNTLVGASTTSMSSGDVTYNNNTSYCGENDWVINVPKDVLGKNCEGVTSSLGDTGTNELKIVGSNLEITGGSDPFQVEPIERPDFNHSGASVYNGNYAFQDGNHAFFLEINNGSYSMSGYDIEGRVYSTETGTYATDGTIFIFTIASQDPSCDATIGDEWALNFSNNIGLALIFKNNKDEIYTAEDISWTEEQFRNAYVGSGFVKGCL